MLVCDTSGLVAYFDAREPNYSRVVAEFEADPGPFVVSPYVVAELDYLLATRRGVGAELAMLAELSGGAWELPAISAGDLRAICTVVDRSRDQAIGAADASLVVLAHRYRTDRLLTLDHRHFDVVRAMTGRRFTVLPG